MLTQAELRALKNADTICFDYIDGEHGIRAIKKAKNSPDGFEQTVYIPCEGEIQNFSNHSWLGREVEKRQVVKCFASVNWPQMSLRWITVTKHLRKDDKLVLCWEAGSRSQILEEAGLTTDRLFLKVLRTSKSGKWLYSEYYIDDRTTSDNSPARMCRVGA